MGDLPGLVDALDGLLAQINIKRYLLFLLYKLCLYLLIKFEKVAVFLVLNCFQNIDCLLFQLLKLLAHPFPPQLLHHVVIISPQSFILVGKLP